jgi:Lipocalin-like domain
MDIRQLTPPRAQAGSSTAELADGNALLGTWKLQSYVVATDAGEKSTPYGEHPNGYLSYSVDGRMQVIGTTCGRIVPHNAPPPDEERVALYETMFAYAGTYSIEDGRVTHHVDISWNEVWTGTDQVRFYEINGNILTLSCRFVNPTDGTEAQYVVAWKKVESPR